MWQERYAEAQREERKLNLRYSRLARVQLRIKPSERERWQAKYEKWTRSMEEFRQTYGDVYPLRLDNIDTLDKFVQWLTEQKNSAKFCRRNLLGDGHEHFAESRQVFRDLEDAFDAADRLGVANRPPQPALNSNTTTGDVVAYYDALLLAAKSSEKLRANKQAKPKRHRRTSKKDLTARQVEAMQLDGEWRGNASAAARRMGVARATYQGHLKAAREKLGRLAPTKAETRALPHDRRGQTSVTGDRRNSGS